MTATGTTSTDVEHVPARLPVVQPVKHPLRRPGAKQTPEQKHRQQQRKIAAIDKEVNQAGFTARIAFLRAEHLSWVEIAQQMSAERGEQVSHRRVREHWHRNCKGLQNIELIRWEEFNRLESVSKMLRTKMQILDEMPIDSWVNHAEEYTKLADSYLKYRERCARMLGLDFGGNNGRIVGHPNAIGKDAFGRDVFAQPGQPGGGNIHIHLPGSVAAYRDWELLQDNGMIDLAGQVLELEANDIVDVEVIPDTSGVVLAPNVDLGEIAEPEPLTALEALDLMRTER